MFLIKSFDDLNDNPDQSLMKWFLIYISETSQTTVTKNIEVVFKK